MLNRRDFLRLTAGGAVCAAAAGAGCSSDSDKTKRSAAKEGPGAGNAASRELRIATWSHFVPAYDTWFDNEFGKRWGEQHDPTARPQNKYAVLADATSFSSVARGTQSPADAVAAAEAEMRPIFEKWRERGKI